jgi:hypothetical protein
MDAIKTSRVLRHCGGAGVAGIFQSTFATDPRWPTLHVKTEDGVCIW